jgi:protein-S-isoprenylcysteine O-methyltransferase Ste14
MSHHFSLASGLLLLAGVICFAAFSWGVKSHFRQTERIPFGTYLISVLTVIGFLWFAWRIIADGLAFTWVLALALFVLSIALFAWTVSATRKTPPTMAFDTDEPSFLLNHGPYQYVRHPFYASYLLYWTGTALASPGLLPWAAPLVMLLVYWNAARREERKFAGSSLAAAYQGYRAKAGMFIPRLRSHPIPD